MPSENKYFELAGRATGGLMPRAVQMEVIGLGLDQRFWMFQSIPNVNVRTFSDTCFIKEANSNAWRNIASELISKYGNDQPPHVRWCSRGLLVRVFDLNDEISAPFRVVADALFALEDYPCLDDELASTLEYEAQIKSISDTMISIDSDLRANTPWDKLWRWLWGNDQEAFLDHGHVSEVAVRKAACVLGWIAPRDAIEFADIVTKGKNRRCK